MLLPAARIVTISKLVVFGCRKNDFATFSSQDARRPILNFLRKGRADLREKFRFHRTENELSHRGKRGPLRGVSAEMTDLELMQISVPFHMEGSPHGLGCYNQRTTATFFLYFSAVFSGFLSILIPFLTSCDPHPPCVPHLSVAFYVVKGNASPEQFRRGFVVFSESRFSTR